MSKTAPVLNAAASEQSHNTRPASSCGSPSRRSGLAVIMASTTSLPRSRIMRVSIGPGATQLIRISVSQISLDNALVKAMTPALAAE